MKKSWKYGLIGAAAALAAVLLPYEIDRNDDGEFSYNSLLLGVYRRKRSDGEQAPEAQEPAGEEAAAQEEA